MCHLGNQGHLQIKSISTWANEGLAMYYHIIRTSLLLTSWWADLRHLSVCRARRIFFSTYLVENSIWAEPIGICEGRFTSITAKGRDEELLWKRLTSFSLACDTQVWLSQRHLFQSAPLFHTDPFWRMQALSCCWWWLLAYRAPMCWYTELFQSHISRKALVDGGYSLTGHQCACIQNSRGGTFWVTLFLIVATGLHEPNVLPSRTLEQLQFHLNLLNCR